MWTALVGMFAAVIGFLGVLVGAMVTGFVTLRQTQLATQREREAQQTAREVARKDALDAFQQETMLGLQDAVEDVRGVVVRDVGRMFVAANQGKPLRDESLVGQVDEGWLQAYARVERLRARTFDAELRALLDKLLEATILPLTTSQVEQAKRGVKDVSDLAHSINERIGVLLPDLF